MSLGEIVLLLLVGIIVVGPRNLPPMMRTAGQWVARLRRMTTDLRSQSGIDDILRQEGLDEHLHQLRSLSRLNVVESLIAPVAAPISGAGASAGASASAMGGGGMQTAQQVALQRNEPLREREYPLIGCDSYDALPDDATTYRMMAQPKPSPAATDATDTDAKDGAPPAPHDEMAKAEAPHEANAASDPHDEMAKAEAPHEATPTDATPEPAADPGSVLGYVPKAGVVEGSSS